MKSTTETKTNVLGRSLKVNMRAIHSRYGQSSDVVVRLFRSDAAPECELALIYITGLVDQKSVNEDILMPLMSLQLPERRKRGDDGLVTALHESVIAVGNVMSVNDMEETLQYLADGKCLILIDGSSVALAADVGGGEKRNVTLPQTQTVIRGPQQGFVENVDTNIALVRRIIRSSDLHVQMHKIGTQTHSNVAVLYIHGVVDEGVLKELYRRLGDIEIDSVLESGYIEEFIQDETFTVFPTMLNTERPDVVSAALLEGRMAILVDGSPMSLIAPTTFFSFFQSAEDYYQRFDIASFVRTIRYVAYVLSMLLPSLYIAMTTFHQEMIPTPLLISIVAQREGVPFSTLVEALLMEMTFEVLREAGLRMPRAIGPAISIVGALVLGQAAVQAGIVSTGMVIIVSFTAISNFVIPEINMAATSRLIRFVIMLMAGFFGIFGIFLSVLILLVHLVSLRSFGVPYMAPKAPQNAGRWSDVFLRIPWWAIVLRPMELNLRNPKRKSNNKKPNAQRHTNKR